MAVTAAQVKAFAPEFAAVADAIVNQWLSWAPGYIATARYGSDTDQGVMLWTCHCLTRTADGAAASAGPVTRDTVGPVTRENAALESLALQSAWNTTGYGQQLLMLARRYGAGGVCI